MNDEQDYRNNAEGMIVILIDHSAILAWEIDNIMLIVCGQEPAAQFIYKYFPNYLLLLERIK